MSKCTLFKPFFVLLFLLASVAVSGQTGRGRPRIENGTLVTDRGTLLRGCYVVQDLKIGVMPSEADIKAVRDFGLNAVHLYGEGPWAREKAGYNAGNIDKIVEWTRENSLYLILTIGGCSDKEAWTLPFVDDFWTFYAARYKDETHVIFEICNEPCEILPFTEAVIQMERNAYERIRSLAPKSHIMFLSAWNFHYEGLLDDLMRFGSDVDWSNASVAAHGYDMLSSGLSKSIDVIRKAGYALTLTEFQSIENNYADVAMIRVLEKEGVSYLNFIELQNLLNKPATFRERIEESDIRWTPDFGTWPASLKKSGRANPYQSTLAGLYDDGRGFRINIEKYILEYTEDGGYAAYYARDFKYGAGSFEAVCSSQANGGIIEIRLDSLDGPIIGKCAVGKTGYLGGDWNFYERFSCKIEKKVTGIHDVYLVFRKVKNLPLYNIKSFEFLVP